MAGTTIRSRRHASPAGRLLSPALALAILFAAAGALAQGAQSLGLGSKSDKPIQVYADQGIEWNQNTRQYIARGNAKAIQGTTTVYGDTLIAYYEEMGDGTTEIYRLDSVGNVRILSPQETAYGDKGVYDIRKGILVMTGKALRLDTQSEIITARDSLEYYEQKSLAVARGNAVSRPKPAKDAGNAKSAQDDRTVRADVLTAHFADRSAPKAKSKAATTAAGGGTALERMEAFGNVVVTRPGEVSFGKRGVYFPDREVAHLWDEVRITRGDNQLNGEFAEVNFRTGISRILSGAKAPVQALIEPEKRPENPRPGN